MTEPSEPTDSSNAVPTELASLRIRYRVRFQKIGLLRWISHRDLAGLWERIVRRAALKLSMSEGFHPKPRIAFPSALALGVEGLDEVVELELAEDISPSELLKRLEADNQPGLIINSVSRLPDGFGKGQLKQSQFSITLPEQPDAATIQTAISKLLSQTTVSVERKKKTLVANVAEQILNLELSDDRLRLTLAASESASLKPHDILDLLGFDDWIENGSHVIRERVILETEFQSNNSAEVARATDANCNTPTEY
nr:TIGR03936 family radical SAM-associated protein [Rhodopirellula maiorica]